MIHSAWSINPSHLFPTSSALKCFAGAQEPLGTDSLANTNLGASFARDNIGSANRHHLQGGSSGARPRCLTFQTRRGSHRGLGCGPGQA